MSSGCGTTLADGAKPLLVQVCAFTATLPAEASVRHYRPHMTDLRGAKITEGSSQLGRRPSIILSTANRHSPLPWGRSPRPGLQPRVLRCERETSQVMSGYSLTTSPWYGRLSPRADCEVDLSIYLRFAQVHVVSQYRESRKSAVKLGLISLLLPGLALDKAPLDCLYVSLFRRDTTGRRV